MNFVLHARSEKLGFSWYLKSSLIQGLGHYPQKSKSIYTYYRGEDEEVTVEIFLTRTFPDSLLLPFERRKVKLNITLFFSMMFRLCWSICCDKLTRSSASSFNFISKRTISCSCIMLIWLPVVIDKREFYVKLKYLPDVRDFKCPHRIRGRSHRVVNN